MKTFAQDTSHFPGNVPALPDRERGIAKLQALASWTGVKAGGGESKGMTAPMIFSEGAVWVLSPRTIGTSAAPITTAALSKRAAAA